MDSQSGLFFLWIIFDFFPNCRTNEAVFTVTHEEISMADRKLWKMRARRHPLAEKPINDSFWADMARLLSVTGLGQAYSLSNRLVKNNEHRFTHAFSSPATRAIMLNAILTAGLGLDIEVLPELVYPSKATKAGTKFHEIFKNMGTSWTLKPLVKHPNWPLLCKHGERALAAILRNVCREKFDKYNLVNVLVTGHFPTLPAMLLAAVGGEKTRLGKKTIGTPLLETAGYTATFDGHQFLKLEFDEADPELSKKEKEIRRLTRQLQQVNRDILARTPIW